MKRRSTLAALIALVTALVYGTYKTGFKQTTGRRMPAQPSHSGPVAAGAGAAGQSVAEAFSYHRSDVWVEASGTVMRLLADDLHGSRHQRFLVELEEGLTILVSHNIDLASRVPLTVGDRVEIHGQYEWNDKGGVVHWTHRDPDNRRPGGWIRLNGREYR